jgi:cytochrome d ubiquinol oxidase subunit II
LLLVAALTLGVARIENPLLFDGLTNGRTALAMHAVTALAALASLWTLVGRRYQLTRAAAAAQASCLLWGWAWTQFPWLLPPDQSITALAAPRITLQLVMTVLGVGTLILLPSFVYLFRVFRGQSEYESAS